jgi:hypothetical protein
MVRGRVAEAGHDHRVVRPAQRLVEAGGQPGLAAQRPGDPDRPGQVAGDRRGLRDHGEVGVAEDLVPATRDRLLRGRGQAERDVHDPFAPSRPGRPGQVEGAGPVVQQRGVVGRSTSARAALPS